MRAGCISTNDPVKENRTTVTVTLSMMADGVAVSETETGQNIIKTVRSGMKGNGVLIRDTKADLVASIPKGFGVIEMVTEKSIIKTANLSTMASGGEENTMATVKLTTIMAILSIPENGQRAIAMAKAYPTAPTVNQNTKANG